MNMHHSGSSYFLRFIKDFGDDAGMFFVGYGFATSDKTELLIGLGLVAISLFLKYNIFKKDE